MSQSSDRPPIDPQKAFSSPLPPPPENGEQGIPPRMPGGSPNPPPLGQYSPPMVPMQSAHRPRHSFVRGIFVTLATTVFGFSLMLNIYLVFASGIVASGQSAQTKVIIEGDLRKKIAVVPLKGVIMEEAYERFAQVMKAVEEDNAVKALVVEIDTPGGSVSASDLIHHTLLKYRREKGLPVVVSMGALATSGGYYVACGADHIVAQRSTMTGNIGVLMPRYNLSEAARRLGIAETTIESTGARYKNAGSMFKPEDPVESRYFLHLIDQAFVQFKSVVQEGRAEKLKQPLEKIADGKVYMADEALQLGLVDQIGYLEDAVASAAGRAGVSDYSAVRFEQSRSLSDFLLGAESQSRTPSTGMTLHISPEVIDRLTTPRMMYLWRGE